MRIAIVFLVACAPTRPAPSTAASRPSAIEARLAGTWQLVGTGSATLSCALGSCHLIGDHFDDTLTYADTVDGTTLIRRGDVEQTCRWQTNDYGGELDCSNPERTEHLQLWCPDETCTLSLSVANGTFGGKRS